MAQKKIFNQPSICPICLETAPDNRCYCSPSNPTNIIRRNPKFTCDGNQEININCPLCKTISKTFYLFLRHFEMVHIRAFKAIIHKICAPPESLSIKQNFTLLARDILHKIESLKNNIQKEFGYMNHMVLMRKISRNLSKEENRTNNYYQFI